ncbi:MAG TPA: FtsX-like permease family protein [Candidatus Binatia bacterium]|nr:FtsX-like permease family protein [Candidatus Binatia bacterium]
MKHEKNVKTPCGFLRRLLTLDEIDDVDGCFEEMYARTAAEKGPGYAKRWIWLQALKSLPGFISHLVYWKLLMLKNTLGVTLRSMLKNKFYFLIKVFGLAAGVACSMVVIHYVTNELTYDTHHPGYDRIYRIAYRQTTPIGDFTGVSTPGPLAMGIREQLSQAETVARMIPPFENAKHVLVARGESRFFEKRVWFADPEIFKIFLIPFLEGSAKTALARPRTVVLGESTARKYFGSLPPLGRSLSIEIDYDTGAAVTEDFEVTGIVRDAPTNTHLKFDMLLSMSTLQAYVPDLNREWAEFHYKYTYVKLGRQVTPSAFERQLQTFSDQLRAAFSKRAGFSMKRHEFFLQPISSLHMDSNYPGEIEPPGNMYYIYIYAIAALLILLIGCINFINLSATLAAARSREVGIRKTLGGSRGDLVFQFLSESMVITFFAFAVAFAFLSGLLSYFNRMAGTDITFQAVGQPLVLASLLALFLTVSFSAGFYPALLLSRFKPVSIMKNQTMGGKQSNGIQRLLVVGQFVICIFLVVCTLVVFRQLNFLKGKALGFSREQKLILEVKSKQAYFRNNFEAIKNDFLKDPGITAATVSSSVPGEAILGGYYLQKGNSFLPANAKRLKVLTVDYDFIRNYGITMTAGRSFQKATGNDAAAAYIVNEAGARELGFTPQSVLGTVWTAHYHRKTKSIVGVTGDFHFLGLKSSAEPLLLDIEKSLLKTITLTIDAKRIASALAAAQDAWRVHFPGVPFEYAFLDEMFGKVYQYEEQMGKLLAMISILGIVIAFLGLYGMVAFYARQRKKEMAIRRVVGASTTSVAFLMTRQFVSLVLLAGIIAVPLAWMATERWLQDFAYHVQPGFPVFAFAFLSAFLIAMAAVLLQSYRAARDNPVDSLRSE